MAIELSGVIAEFEPDGLITGVAPAILVGGGTLSNSGTDEVTYARGTLLARSGSDLSAYTGSGTVDSILTDDVTLAASESEAVTVYISGCFNQTKVEEVSSYELTDDDIATLRTKGIYFKAAQAQ